MSDKLSILIDNYIDKCGYTAKSKDDELIIEKAKKQIKQEISKEICEEMRDKALREADTIIKNRVEMHHIKELRKLAIEGLIVAFFVGLLVNQVTDIIGFLKGTVTLDSIIPTIILVLFFSSICVLIFLLEFISTFIKLWRKAKNETN